MGCASSKPSSSSATTTKSSKKKGDKAVSPNKGENNAAVVSNNRKTSATVAPSGKQLNGSSVSHHQHHDSNGSATNVHDKSPLHLKQQAQAERARRLAHRLHIEQPLLHEIDQQRNRVITHLVTSVRRDLNSELIAAPPGSGGHKMADLVMAAAAASDTDDLITDVVSRAVLLILNGTAGNTYKDLLDQLKSHQYLCKHQQHKQRICEITVDTIYGALQEGGGGNDGDVSLVEFLTGESSYHQAAQQHNHHQQRTPSSGGGGGEANFQEAVLLSRSQAKEVARILFLTDRARPVVHASPNSAHKDAYIVNKQLSDMSEVTVSKSEIDEILRAFEQPESIEIVAPQPQPQPQPQPPHQHHHRTAKNLIDDFNSITNTSTTTDDTLHQTVVVSQQRVVSFDESAVAAPATQITETTIQFEEPQQAPQQQQAVDEQQHQQQTAAAQEALNTLAAITALAAKVEQTQQQQQQQLHEESVELDSNNNTLETTVPVEAVKNSSENISSNSSSSAHAEQHSQQENGELDPILKQSLLDDRFYNNDAFKTEPPVNGENTNEAATVIQAGFKGHLERKETGSKQQEQQQQPEDSSEINTIKISNTSPESTSNSTTLEKKKKKSKNRIRRNGNHNNHNK